LASSSAFSLPSIPSWAGIQWKITWNPASRHQPSSSIADHACTASSRSFCLYVVTSRIPGVCLDASSTAALARLSARSLPSTPLWPGSYCICTLYPSARRWSSCLTISRTIYWPDCLRSGSAHACTAAWLSVSIITSVSTWGRCSSASSAMPIPTSSAA
jgi:hypothetical protein